MDISYYQKLAAEDIKKNRERNDQYYEIDDEVNCYFELPPELIDLPWIGNRRFISNAPRNAVQAATRTFSTLLPSVEITPLKPEPAIYERVEKMEQAIMWHFQQLNTGRDQSTLWKIVESAVKYCNVSMQTEYMPYIKKDQKGKRVKQIKRRGDYNFVVHHPSTVNASYSEDGLERVTLDYQCSIQDLIYKFGEDNSGIAKYLSEMDSKRSERGADRATTIVSFYDVTDWENRAIWFTDMDGNDMADNVGTKGSAYVIGNEKHGLSFIPWVVKDNKEPILKYTYDTWANLNIVKTVIFSKHIDLAGHPNLEIQVLDTNDKVDIRNDSPGSPVITRPGQKVNALPPPPLDPQMSKTEMDLAAEIYQSSAASILGSVERIQGETFSSMNAIIQAALAQLGLVKMTAEQALAEGFYQIFRWIDYSKEPLRAYRYADKDEQRRKGQQITIMPGEEQETKKDVVYFDPDELYITVNLKANTLADEQSRITNEINKVERLGFSRQTAYENVGGMDFEREQGQRGAEVLFDSEISREIKYQDGLLDLKLQKQAQLDALEVEAARMQQMQQMQAPQGPTAPTGQNPQAGNQQMNAAGAFAGAQGMETRGGGIAPQGGAPGVGREQVNRASATGEGLA